MAVRSPKGDDDATARISNGRLTLTERLHHAPGEMKYREIADIVAGFPANVNPYAIRNWEPSLDYRLYTDYQQPIQVKESGKLPTAKWTASRSFFATALGIS